MTAAFALLLIAALSPGADPQTAPVPEQTALSTPPVTQSVPTTSPAATDPATTDPATTDPATTDPATTGPAVVAVSMLPSSLTGSAPDVGAPRDPFATTRSMQDEARRGVGGARFEPTAGAGPLPVMRLRGWIEDASGQALALVDIEGYGTTIVRKDDTIGLPWLQADAVLRIRSVSNGSVAVEIGSLGHVIVVR